MNNVLKIIGITLISLVAVISFAQAQTNPFNIDFPISELGNCSSVEECKIYCDNPANVNSCIEWAEGEGIIESPKDDGILLENGGPGGCSTPESCDAFCSQTENHDQCFNFAKEHNLIPPEELERIEEFKDQEQKTGLKSKNHLLSNLVDTQFEALSKEVSSGLSSGKYFFITSLSLLMSLFKTTSSIFPGKLNVSKTKISDPKDSLNQYLVNRSQAVKRPDTLMPLLVIRYSMSSGFTVERT